MGQCLNKLILRCSDSETAQIMSETIGERVMHRVSENTSYGANSIRDGVGIAPREEKEPVYLPTDLMNLPSLQGIVRMSNKRAGRPFPSRNGSLLTYDGSGSYRRQPRCAGRAWRTLTALRASAFRAALVQAGFHQSRPSDVPLSPSLTVS